MRRLVEKRSESRIFVRINLCKNSGDFVKKIFMQYRRKNIHDENDCGRIFFCYNVSRRIVLFIFYIKINNEIGE